MEATILESRILHQVLFFPNPNNPSHSTTPIYTPTRDLVNLGHIPTGAQHVTFQDVVVSMIKVGDTTKAVISGPFNETRYQLYWEAKEIPAESGINTRKSVEVPRDYVGEISAFETDPAP